MFTFRLQFGKYLSIEKDAQKVNDEEFYFYQLETLLIKYYMLYLQLLI